MPNVWHAEVTRFAPGQFGNPWHDEIGRFAPKGTGTKFDGPDWHNEPRSDAPASKPDWHNKPRSDAPRHEIPTESKLKSVEVDDFADEVSRTLRETIAGLHDPPRSIRETVKDWVDKLGDAVRDLVDTGPPDDSTPPLPWLRPPRRDEKGQLI